MQGSGAHRVSSYHYTKQFPLKIDGTDWFRVLKSVIPSEREINL